MSRHAVVLNPAASVRGPKHRVSEAITLAITPQPARRLVRSAGANRARPPRDVAGGRVGLAGATSPCQDDHAPLSAPQHRLHDSRPAKARRGVKDHRLDRTCRHDVSSLRRPRLNPPDEPCIGFGPRSGRAVARNSWTGVAPALTITTAPPPARSSSVTAIQKRQRAVGSKAGGGPAWWTGVCCDESPGQPIGVHEPCSRHPARRHDRACGSAVGPSVYACGG